jgi:hypothetical protein
MKNSTAQTIINMLDRAVRDDAVREGIDPISRRVDKKLSASSDDSLAWEPIPLNLYTEELPEIVQSSWVFVIPADTNTGAERHSNSHQFMMSYRGQGDLQVKRGDQWLSNCLVSDLDERLEKRWVSIPPGIWHRVVTDEASWTVVSFHTVVAEDLIEERPDTSETDTIHQRYYISRKNKKIK